jgi:rhomboid family GlyGly-CTERM serine protease
MQLRVSFAGQAWQIIKRSAMTLTLAGCALALFVVSDAAPWFTLEFRELSPAGVYRLMTCHWLHWSANHLMWDVAMFAVLGSLCERRSRGRFLGTLLVSAIAIPLVVMAVHLELGSYRGLSGIDSALFGLLVAEHFVAESRARNWVSAAMFGLMGASLFVKIALEIHAQANLFVSDTSFTPVPLAHLVGAIVGLAIGAWSRRSSLTAPLSM